MSFTSRLSSRTLDSLPQGNAVKRILSAALDAADPANAVFAAMQRKKNLLTVGKQSYALQKFAHIHLIAFGKAAPSMANAASEILGEFLSGGIVISKHKAKCHNKRLTLHLAGHPVPDKRSKRAARAILNLLAQSGKDDLVIFLISGGGSALITSPRVKIGLNDLQKLTSLLLASGARIDEINTLRRALDQVKGGGLARAAYPAQQMSLILSDVVNSPLAAIASGPTVPNPTANADALTILKKYALLKKTPSAILSTLAQQETRLSTPLGNTLIVGSNRISAEAARDAALAEGFKARILTTSLQGEAADKGNELALNLIAAKEQPLCLIASGETTVSLGNLPAGKGGRNQEMALAAVTALKGAKQRLFITLATDGEDGPTDAAGAVVTGETFARASALGLNPKTHLQTHNAYLFFDALGDLLKPGPSGTNVNDLAFLFSFP
jgi:hydroxypyruvate reductase